MNKSYIEQVLREGDELLAELERKERERAERRRGLKSLVYTDERGRSYGKWVKEFTAR